MLADTVVTPFIETYNHSVYAQYTVQVHDRQAVQEELKTAGIPTTVHYPVPLHLQPAFAAKGVGRGAFPHSEQAADHVLSLPMHPYLSAREQAQIANALRRVVEPVLMVS
jgi:UDP-2-acetamido-2-deoxy-ribo-hexuluronate aminotransferase